MMRSKPYDFSYSPAWNLFLITVGSAIWALGVSSIVVHHHFIVGGLYGVGLLINYVTGSLSPAIWFALLNIPLFAVSWIWVSRRFFLYSLYAMVVVTLFCQWIHFDFGIHDQIYAAIAAGVICGAGSGLVFRSLGSGGGLDVVAVTLNQKFNLGLGRFYIIFNAILFAVSAAHLDIDLIIASMLLVYISSQILESVLSMFSQRKMVYIISDKNTDIGRKITEEMHKGATFIKAKGAYSGQDRDIIMAITDNVQLKRLEAEVFTIDPNALFIVENTFNVVGSVFGRRKIY